MDWLTLITAVLAGAIAWLGKSTRDLAQASSNELRAQWRPILLPHRPHDGNLAAELDSGGSLLRIRIATSGNGPALFIRAELDPLGLSPRGERAALAKDDRAILQFDTLPSPLPPFLQLLLDYRDLVGRAYSSAIVLTTPTAGSRGIEIYDVQLRENEHLTHHGDSLPQQGLKALPEQTARKARRWWKTG